MAYLSGALDAEWRDLVRSRQARRVVARWAMSHRVFRGVRDLDEVLELRRDPNTAPELLSALASLVVDDEVAARALLQAMLPGLLCLADKVGHDDREAFDEMVSLAWERIRTYPVGREGSVAGNVLWDVRKRYRAHRVIDAPTGPPPAIPSGSGWAHVKDVPSAEHMALERVVLDDLVAATRRGVLSRQSLSLVIRTRLAGALVGEIAEENGATPVAIQQRRWRAEQRLRDEFRAAG